MSDSYDDYEAKIQLAEHAWEKRVVKTEHDRAVELGKAYERGWNAALAQQEPVAWMFVNEDGECEQIEYGPVFDDPGVTPLYAAPPKRDLTCVCGAVWDGEQMVHAPRKREWVGLTDDDVFELADTNLYDGVLAFAKAIEQALKEKNDGH